MLKQIGDWLKGLIVRPMSVGMDIFISVCAGVVLYGLLGLIVDILPFGDALRSALGGVFASMVYMRARTNLLDPTPAFKT